MIEKCIFCGETHETGGDDTIDGIPIKVCPTIPETVGGYFINPKEWRFRDTSQPHELT